MKTLIYGAGPLGLLYAAKLHLAGVDVALLARGQRLADLREHGVVLEDAFSGVRETHHVPVDAWLVTHIPAIMVFLGLFAADLDPARFARTRDAMVLGVRARDEALRAQQAAGIPISPTWFKSLP